MLQFVVGKFIEITTLYVKILLLCWKHYYIRSIIYINLWNNIIFCSKIPQFVVRLFVENTRLHVCRTYCNTFFDKALFWWYNITFLLFCNTFVVHCGIFVVHVYFLYRCGISGYMGIRSYLLTFT